MARAPIRLQAKGLGVAKGLFSRIRQFGADPSELLGIWGALIEASTRTRFDTGRGPFGIPWPITKRQISGAVGASGPVKNKILVDKGILEGSIRFAVHPHAFEVGVDGVGESVRNAHVHQFGFQGTIQIPAHDRTITQAFGIPLPSPKTFQVRAHSAQQNIPKRAFLGIDDVDRTDMKEVALEHLRELLK